MIEPYDIDCHVASLLAMTKNGGGFQHRSMAFASELFESEPFVRAILASAIRFTVFFY